MAKKELIIQSEGPITAKCYAMLRCISHEMEANTAKLLKNFGLSETQLMILDALEHTDLEVMTVNQIKAVMTDDNPNVSRSLNKLMENGYVVKERDLIDQRVVKIRITKEGRKIHQEADKMMLQSPYSTVLSKEEFHTLYELLKKL